MKKVLYLFLPVFLYIKVNAQSSSLIKVNDFNIQLNNSVDTSKQVINLIDYDIKSSQIDSVVVLLHKQAGSNYYKRFSSKLDFSTFLYGGYRDSTFGSSSNFVQTSITTRRTSNGNLIYKVGTINVFVENKEIVQNEIKCISFYFVSNNGNKSQIYTKCLVSLNLKLEDYNKDQYFFLDQTYKVLTFKKSVLPFHNSITLYSIEGRKLFEGDAYDFYFDCTNMSGRIIIATCSSNSGELYKCKVYVS